MGGKGNILLNDNLSISSKQESIMSRCDEYDPQPKKKCPVKAVVKISYLHRSEGPSPCSHLSQE